MIRKIIKPIFNLFSGIQVTLYILLIFALAVSYLYLITRNVEASVITGLITALFLFYYLVYVPKKLYREQYLMKELQKYATNVNFYLKSGYNVMKALESSKRNLDPEIQRDIDKTLEGLRKNAELQTDHFKKYNFYSINVFHQILRIKYEKGGKSSNLFNQIYKSINFEIVKRDELYRRKNVARKQIMVMMGMVLAIPLILVLFAKEVYMTFLSFGFFSVAITISIYLLILVSLYFLQKASTDLSLNH